MIFIPFHIFHFHLFCFCYPLQYNKGEGRGRLREEDGHSDGTWCVVIMIFIFILFLSFFNLHHPPSSLPSDRIKALRSREAEQSDKLERRLADRTVIAAQIDGTYITPQFSNG